MGKQALLVYLCTGKECRKVWHRLDGSPTKWLKRRLEEAELPYKLNVVKTECMDHCEHAACLCVVAGTRASLETDLRPDEDADHVLAALRACAERAEPA